MLKINPAHVPSISQHIIHLTNQGFDHSAAVSMALQKAAARNQAEKIQGKKSKADSPEKISGSRSQLTPRMPNPL